MVTAVKSISLAGSIVPTVMEFEPEFYKALEVAGLSQQQIDKYKDDKRFADQDSIDDFLCEVDKNSYTFLHHAVENNCHDPKIISQLIPKNPIKKLQVLFQKNNCGFTPLSLAVCGNSNEEIIELLIPEDKEKRDELLCQTDFYKRSSLILAIFTGYNEALLKLLIPEDKEKRDELLLLQPGYLKCSPLRLAINTGYSEEALKLLIPEDKEKRYELLSQKKDSGANCIEYLIFKRDYTRLRLFSEMKVSYNCELSEHQYLRLLFNVGSLAKEKIEIRDFEGIGDDYSAFYFINKILKGEMNQDLQDAIESYLDFRQYNPIEVCKRIKEGKPTIVNASCQKHAIYCLVYEGYFFIFNRGAGRKEPSVICYKINANKIDKIDISWLMDKEKSIESKYKIVNGFAEGKDNLCKALEKTAKQKTQKTGNCGWAGPKLLTSLMLFLPDVFKDKDVTSIDELEAKFEEGFLKKGKQFSLKCRNEIYEQSLRYKNAKTEKLFNEAKKKLDAYSSKYSYLELK
ncbi:MAG: ankyrin repeat domain-containing protein [Parachlamydiales bacterium]|nr:ankyrin repeat domain-containing protein [Parachlamydiales bacterium]